MRPRVRSVLFTDPPLSDSQLSDQIQPREAIAEAPDLQLKTSLTLPGTDVSVDQASVRGVAVDSRSSAESESVHVQVAFRPARLGMRTFPPSVEGELLDPPDLVVVR